MSGDRRSLLQAAGQEHLLAYWNELAPTQQQQLAAQIDQVDLQRIARLYRAASDQSPAAAAADRIAPPAAFRLIDQADPALSDAARRAADAALRDGRLGVVLVAGGQGSRLGFPHPKGMFPIGPISQRTLFQLHVEKLLAVRRRYDVAIPLYLMTSPATHEETVAFFAEHDRFGLPADDLIVFCQGTMPAVDAENGRILLAAKDSLALSPDGHGGTLAALRRCGCLDDMRTRGIRHLFYFQVDNPMVALCDRLLLGHHLNCSSELSTLVVPKVDAEDRVGNVVSVDGRLHVIEYSDVLRDPALAAQFRRRNADDSLQFWAGSIAVHLFDVAFLARMAAEEQSLPFHLARKKVACLDRRGRRHDPSEPNAIKFEQFIFDLMPGARNAVVVEGDAARWFAPVKNADGEATETPSTSRAALVAQYAGWLRAAGAQVDDNVAVEISPLFALDGEQLAQRIGRETHVAEPTVFQ